MKIGAIVAVNCDRENIWYCLRGIYDFCDEVVVVYSDTTWTGNKYEDDTVKIIDTFPDEDRKLKIIKGSFLTQPEQRNVGLKYLKENNFDYVFVVDSDEFYSPSTLISARDFIEKNSNKLAFRVFFKQMWKTLEWVLVPNKEFFAFFKLLPEFNFVGPSRQAYYGRNSRKHILNMATIETIDCFHLTCVCSNAYMKEKLITRNYRNVVLPRWFEDVWMKWTPEMTNLHPTKAHIYKKAEKLDKNLLPEFVRTHKFYK
jgi:hypothetical protein